MTTLQTNYPSTSTVDVVCTTASLPTAVASTMLVGRVSAKISNATTLDIDHQISGEIVTGTSPTAGSQIEVYLVPAIKMTAGVPTFPDGIDGTDSAKTLTRADIKYSGFYWLATITVTGVSNQVYPVKPVSIAQQYGGSMPMEYCVMQINGTGVNLNATQTPLQILRIQNQAV
jgi:hypothetical protein